MKGITRAIAFLYICVMCALFTWIYIYVHDQMVLLTSLKEYEIVLSQCCKLMADGLRE